MSVSTLIFASATAGAPLVRTPIPTAALRLLNLDVALASKPLPRRVPLNSPLLDIRQDAVRDRAEHRPVRSVLHLRAPRAEIQFSTEPFERCATTVCTFINPRIATWTA